ncbi:hypothetical protein SpCBS45565_g05656 [Spizellomyces sp. 'palustris']|nr:hypothetical protein SpCBS45565_g05656 [Spizellomyces sp. 'palustris']
MHGNPYDTYNVFGFKIPRYKLALYTVLGYTGIIVGYLEYRKHRPPPPIEIPDKEEEEFVKRYVVWRLDELKKPELVRRPFDPKAAGL